MAYNHISNKTIINDCKLTDRLNNNATCASNFSRWLHGRGGLLQDYELDRIRNWLSQKGPMSRPDLLGRLLPDHLPFSLQNWLTSGRDPSLRFENEYAVYRCSAIALQQVVVGRLTVTANPSGGIRTAEAYQVNDDGPRSGEYKSDGAMIESDEGDLYFFPDSATVISKWCYFRVQK